MSPIPPPLPEGDGPLIWLRLAASEPADGSGAAAILRQALLSLPAGLRCLVTHPAAGSPAAGAPAADDPLPDPGAIAAPAFIAASRPAAVLLLGDELPEPLLLALARARVPVVMADARLECLAPPFLWHRSRRRAAIEAIDRLLVADLSAFAGALRAGIAATRIERVGPLTPVHEPPSCSELEHEALTIALAGRQIWYAANIPPAEEAAVLGAHEAALGHSHRALLLVSPADPRRAPALAARAGQAGFVTALRSLSDEPEPALQVLVADDPGEAGLWYRLAPVTFAGSTLEGGGESAPHPCDPASLGSAILRGPHLATGLAEWGSLDAAAAVRVVRDAAGLALGVEDLLAPDRAADLAARAWQTCTAGAAVAQRVAEVVASVLEHGPSRGG